jgi:hypothetical protein
MSLEKPLTARSNFNDFFHILVHFFRFLIPNKFKTAILSD